MAKKFKHIDETAPRPGREGGIFEESKPSEYKKPQANVSQKNEQKEAVPKTASMLIKEMDYSLMEKLKNIVYTEKVGGDFFVTQSSIAIRAIEEFVTHYDKAILERPDRIKETEKKLRRR